MSSLAITEQFLFEKPTLTHTTLYRFSELPTQDSAIRHCKNYLDTFKEHLEERHLWERKYSYSKSVELQRKTSQTPKNYRNYEKMVSYSMKKHNTQKIEEIRSLIHQKPKNILKKRSNLNDIVSNKMIRELVYQNNFLCKDENVQEILKDNTQRQQLFQESILIDRLIQIRKNSQAAKGKRKASRIEDHSKHFHLNEIHRDANAFYRRKYVKQNITFQYQNKITKFQTTKLRKRQEQNRTLMKNIMNNYSKQIQFQKGIDSDMINETIKRMFLHYSSEGSVEESYININRSHLQQFLKDFQFQTEGNDTAREIAALKSVNYMQFVQLVYSLHKVHSNGSISQFLKQNFIKKSFIYIPSECSLYQQRIQEIEKAFKVNKVQQRLENICKNMKKIGVELNGDRWLNFDDFHELMLLLKIYPTFVSKKKLKYYYLYSESSCNLIQLKDIKQIIGYISMENQQHERKRLTQMINLIRQYRG